MCEYGIKNEVSIDFSSMVLILVGRKDYFVVIRKDNMSCELHKSIEKEYIEFVEKSIKHLIKERVIELTLF